MILHRDDLHALYEGIMEMFDPCTGVIQFAVHDGDVCRIERDGDFIWFSLWEGSLDRPDLEPIELGQMAAKFEDSDWWTDASRTDGLEAIRKAGHWYVASQSRNNFMKLCHAIVAYYAEHHHNDPDLFHLHDQAQDFLGLAEAGELDTKAVEMGWWDDVD